MPNNGDGGYGDGRGNARNNSRLAFAACPWTTGPQINGSAGAHPDFSKHGLNRKQMPSIALFYGSGAKCDALKHETGPGRDHDTDARLNKQFSAQMVCLDVFN